MLHSCFSPLVSHMAIQHMAIQPSHRCLQEAKLPQNRLTREMVCVEGYEVGHRPTIRCSGILSLVAQLGCTGAGCMWSQLYMESHRWARLQYHPKRGTGGRIGTSSTCGMPAELQHMQCITHVAGASPRVTCSARTTCITCSAEIDAGPVGAVVLGDISGEAGLQWCAPAWSKFSAECLD
jgi:hypothetical protein